MSIAEIRQLPRGEKVKLLEAIWADLAQDDASVDSPAWHALELRETEARLAAGAEEIVDWEVAKSKLRAGNG